jgi:flagella basal body P-ring formation protein FlgA
MSGKAGRSGRSLAPARPGEQVSRGVSSEWTPSSLSLVLLLSALLVVANSAGPARAGTAIPAAVLAPVEATLRASCGCDSFMVRWSIPEAVAAGVAALDSLVAVPEASVAPAEAPGGPNGSVAGPDRVPVRLRGRQHGRAVEYLVVAEPLCAATLLSPRRPVRAGSVLGPDDLAPLDGWFSPSALREAPVTAVGKAARHALTPGRPLCEADLSEAALVRRGATVHVHCRRGAISIDGEGVARKDGCQGDRIEVRLSGAAKDCVAVVTGPDEVEVVGEGGGS